MRAPSSEEALLLTWAKSRNKIHWAHHTDTIDSTERALVNGGM